MKRHYNGLKKEIEKKRSNPTVINAYLNKEFDSRRTWIKNLAASERVKKLMQSYPCFKDHVEVVTLS